MKKIKKRISFQILKPNKLTQESADCVSLLNSLDLLFFHSHCFIFFFVLHFKLTMLTKSENILKKVAFINMLTIELIELI